MHVFQGYSTDVRGNSMVPTNASKSTLRDGEGEYTYSNTINHIKTKQEQQEQITDRLVESAKIFFSHCIITQCDDSFMTHFVGAI